MSQPGPLEEYERVLSIVRGWPPEQRRRLVRAVERDLPAEPQARRGPATLEEFWASLPPDFVPPTDEEVEQWLDERRMRHLV